MTTPGDNFLLHRFRLCRADMIAALSVHSHPPDAKTLRDLADLQLAIMATEAAIADKTDAAFLAEFTNLHVVEAVNGRMRVAA
jgi:hypothetical protein